MYNKNLIGSTLFEALIAVSQCEDRGITIVTTGNQKFISYQQLFQRAIQYLNYFKDEGVNRGDELMISSAVNENGEFFYSFWACILGGIIPVPVSGTSDKNSTEKILNIWPQLINPHIVISSGLIKKIQQHAGSSQLTVYSEIKERAICIDEITTENISPSFDINSLPKASPENIAFIQYSSGSTSLPKGVVLTHQNLISNINDSIERSALSDTDSTLSWMPLSHDMGLIGFHLTPLVKGINQFIMPTELFIKNPALWLQAVSNHKITVTASPNFGLSYSLKYGLRKLSTNTDLSSLRLLLNGAEPISVSLCEQFIEATEKYKLNKQCLYPVYGLAEASLSVTYPKPSSGLKSLSLDRRFLNVGEQVQLIEQQNEYHIRYANLGMVLNSCELKIVDDHNQDLGENTVGHIFIRGKNVTSEYYNNKQKTEEVITRDGWLNTGDLGVLVNKCLYVTGRKKDVIFVNGQNFYSHDVEHACTEIEGVELGKIAACSIYNTSLEREELILFVAAAGISDEKLITHVSSKFHIKVDKVIPVKKIPKTSSGKLQRFKLLEDYREQKLLNIEQKKNIISEKEDINSISLNKKEITNWLIKKLSNELEIPGESISAYRPLAQYGLDSKTAVRISGEIEDEFKITIPATLLWDYPTIDELSKFLCGDLEIENPVEKESVVNKQYSGFAIEEPIAIVGMGCRFPGGANSPELFWEVLKNGKDCISVIPDERWDVDALYDSNSELQGKMNTRHGGFIKDVDCFDGDFFGISRNEIEAMDPQQRIVLEVCWEALENAGINPEKLKGTETGVYLGISSFDFSQISINEQKPLDTYLLTGSSHGTAAGRISYLLGLNGPSMAIDTACSSSLVSLHYACQDLKLKETNTAIVAGVNLLLSPQSYIALTKLNALSPDGKCKTFDESANGYVRGEGCGVVILKRLSDAISQKDNIHAIIKSTAVNQDGQSQGLTAPNGKSQEALINKALNKASVDPTQVSYIETHGTGTVIGDSIETNTLQNIFLRNKNRTTPLCLGSVKTNIGHLEAAAGIAGLIKSVLSIKNEAFPPHLNLKKLNKSIKWESLPVQIPTSLIPWKHSEIRRIAGVSSFGFGGTNAHVIVEEYIEKKEKDIVNKDDQLLCISAKSKKSLLELVDKYIDFLKQNKKVPLQEICYTANTGRSHFYYRMAFFGNSHEDILGQMEQFCENNGELVLNSSNPQLKVLIENYRNNEEINWNEYYQYKTFRKAELPTYSFQKKKYVVFAPINRLNFEPGEIDQSLTDALIQKQEFRKSSSVLSKLDRIADSQRKQFISDYISQQARSILGYDDNFYMDVKKPFFELGFDSLMAVYLKNKLSEAFKVKIFASMVYEYPNIDRLSQYIYNELYKEKEPDGESETLFSDELVINKEIVLKSSDQEVAKLLIEKLNKFNSPDDHDV